MLKLTKKADYGLIALKHLVVHGPDSSSAKEIAEMYGIPLSLLSKILQKLVKNGFLRSEPGTNGGYRLAPTTRHTHRRGPIRSTDGPHLLSRSSSAPGVCCATAKCRTRGPCQQRTV